MSKHTPGPWKVNPKRRIVSIHHGHDSRDLALVRFTGDEAQCDANARLIAAAPELLNAAKCALERFRHIAPGDARCSAEVVLLLDAIAKAEGRE